MNPRRPAALATLALALLAGLAPASDRPGSELYPVRSDARPVMLDGSVDEWPEGVVAMADESFVYIRFRVDGPPRAIQAADETLTILLDLDGNAATGLQLPEPAAAAELGADLRIRLSPRGRNGLRGGVEVHVFSADGRETRISHADAGFIVAPTHAAEPDERGEPGWYEARIARSALDLRAPTERAERAAERDAPRPQRGALPDTGVQGQPLDITPRGIPPLAWGAGVILSKDEQGELLGWSDPFAFHMPAPAEPALSDFIAPPKAVNAVRVLSYNVERAAPNNNPAPFARVITALQPDIILVQEWDGASDSDLVSWMQRHVGGEWNAVSAPDRGVAIVTRYSVVRSVTEPVYAEEHVPERPVRSVTALLQTPIRDTVVTSVHLKCCGGYMEAEDHTRVAEAVALNTMIGSLPRRFETTRIIGGDLNLVGSTAPLITLAQGLDLDASELSVAPAEVLGDATQHTWARARSSFSPGRLDYILYSDSNARVSAAFTLDTSVLSDTALQTMGLHRTDSEASDHLPMVVDYIAY